MREKRKQREEPEESEKGGPPEAQQRPEEDGTEGGRAQELEATRTSEKNRRTKKKRAMDWNELIWMDHIYRLHLLEAKIINMIIASNERIKGATARGTNGTIRSLAMVRSTEASD
jgi:hypothetical protein